MEGKKSEKAGMEFVSEKMKNKECHFKKTKKNTIVKKEEKTMKTRKEEETRNETA